MHHDCQDIYVSRRISWVRVWNQTYGLLMIVFIKTFKSDRSWFLLLSWQICVNVVVGYGRNLSFIIISSRVFFSNTSLRLNVVTNVFHLKISSWSIGKNSRAIFSNSVTFLMFFDESYLIAYHRFRDELRSITIDVCFHFEIDDRYF